MILAGGSEYPGQLPCMGSLEITAVSLLGVKPLHYLYLFKILSFYLPDNNIDNSLKK